LVKLLMEKSPITEDYFIPLWQGSFLPTDNQQLATQVVNALYQELVEKGEAPPAIPISPSLDTLHQLRHHYEQRLSQLAELTYANEQRNCFDDILLWLRAIETGKSQRKQSGEKIQVPSGEGPVYLEWIIWRAFLAINALCNMPWEGRRFKIDQDFMPISCAPSGGPDMIMEFEEMALVIEVTLTTSSRQEAAEGEPVRRHVAQLADHYKNKAVYGLFLAKRIDSNTAHTFRSGDWYRKDDSKLSLQIIPLTLSDFYFLLTNYQKGLNKLSNDMRSLLIECRASANESAPKWKQCIHDIVKRFCERNRRRDE
ncbi:MAG: AlwI family type II restriction endonuclease, partial [Gammaproteobacteria bacterium]|nr:AlwI family type II restriction endonuclease [Gammaproteobacteria bacterium]